MNRVFVAAWLTLVCAILGCKPSADTAGASNEALAAAFESFRLCLEQAEQDAHAVGGVVRKPDVGEVVKHIDGCVPKTIRESSTQSLIDAYGRQRQSRPRELSAKVECDIYSYVYARAMQSPDEILESFLTSNVIADSGNVPFEYDLAQNQRMHVLLSAYVHSAGDMKLLLLSRIERAFRGLVEKRASGVLFVFDCLEWACDHPDAAVNVDYLSTYDFGSSPPTADVPVYLNLEREPR